MINTQKTMLIIYMLFGFILYALTVAYIIAQPSFKKGVDEGRGIVPTPTITVGEYTKKPTEQEARFIEEMRVVFLGGCVEDAGADEAYCNCLFSTMLHKSGIDGFMQQALEYNKTDKLPPEMIEAMAQCISL